MEYIISNLIEFLKKLGSVPLVTIPFGVIIGLILNIVYENWKNRKVTKQILSIVHNEIINNLVKPTDALMYTKSTRREYKRLSTMSGNVFMSKIGILTISPEQIQSILKIYEIFNFINNAIVDLKNNKSRLLENAITKQIKKYYTDLKEEIDKYKEKWKLNIDIEDIFEDINDIIKY